MKFTSFALTLAVTFAAVSLAGCGGGAEASIGGALTGLNPGQTITLQDNGTSNLTLDANGTFQFPQDLVGLSGYSVTILSQPAAQICEVANGTGQVDASGDSIANVAVACVGTSSIGGAVNGLAPGATLTLSNGTVLLPLANNGAFAFPGVLIQGAPYQVTVATQPPGQICTVTNSIGVVTPASESAVAVSCS